MFILVIKGVDISANTLTLNKLNTILETLTCNLNGSENEKEYLLEKEEKNETVISTQPISLGNNNGDLEMLPDQIKCCSPEGLFTIFAITGCLGLLGSGIGALVTAAFKTTPCAVITPHVLTIPVCGGCGSLIGCSLAFQSQE